jgi:hypothetical protein
MQTGAMFMLNLAVCLPAASPPISGAKVPHVIAKWLPVRRQAIAIMRRAISLHAIAKLAARPSALGARKSQCDGWPASGRISGS